MVTNWQRSTKVARAGIRPRPGGLADEVRTMLLLREFPMVAFAAQA